jgi:cell fate (sporulation/competence/biofilm development) regulator YlbF (YheA/YmcA/DUF963 family)
MVVEICEHCGNKFDKRGMRRHRESCRKRKQRDQEAAEKHKGNANRDAQIHDLFEKTKHLQHMIDDLSSQLIKLIKEI